MPDVDAIVVGASVAGTATAALLGRQGVSVALLEKSPDPRHYKHLCTHEIAAVANPVFERLGVMDELRQIAGPHRSTRLWTTAGWTRPGRIGSEPIEDGVNVRRERLDPLLREVAASTPGVTLSLGTRVIDVLRSESGAVGGVVTTNGKGRKQRLTARVVIGADGATSAVAKLTGTPTKVARHERFGYAGYFEGVPAALEDGKPMSRFWLLGPDLVYAFPTDGGLTLLCVAPLKSEERLRAFKRDLSGEFFAMFEDLTDGPDLSRARQVGKFHGQIASINHRRRVAAPGLAFVGDAAQVTDFVWGTGCGFAVGSAELLADALGPALTSKASDRILYRALLRYRRAHGRAFASHYLQTSSFSTDRALTLPERMLFSAAVDDDHAARAVRLLGSRTRQPWQAITPAVAGRIALHHLSVPITSGAPR